jgi:radical SAM superfamily enzyme YgiQ (UPF0313 family)
MNQILLGAINSTYQHCSIGIRYLYANLNELQNQCEMIEWTIKESPLTIVETIIQKRPKILGLGVYIWNTSEVFEVCSILKKVSPETIIVLGGPEISYETETNPLVGVCDFIIKGEADLAFYQLVQKIMAGQDSIQKIIPAILPEIKSIKMPYSLFTENDITNRIIYVEASRGCPYKCEYCLSSLDKSVRSFELKVFLCEMQTLIDRGARVFKFVDRTFNLSPTTSTEILNFFLKQIHLNFFLHFEMVPDRLPNEIKELIIQFPKGSLQFEIGIQTLNPEVAQNVSRKNDLVKVKENFHYLKTKTNVHTHADLIAGLPGESIDSFARGFDLLHSWSPDEIQLGILKRLKGTPIIRHKGQFAMAYSGSPPFQILSSTTMTYLELQKISRISKFWDSIANSGDFPGFTSWIAKRSESIFWEFYFLSDFLFARHKSSHSIALLSLVESLYQFLLSKDVPPETAKNLLINDYCFGLKRRDVPQLLKTHVSANQNHAVQKQTNYNHRQLNR